VRVNIPLLRRLFSGAAQVAVIPGTNVYAVPDVKDDISFTVVGGGVPGKAAGTAHITMTEVGFTTNIYHLFTDMLFPVGEIITGITGGIGYITRSCTQLAAWERDRHWNVCMEYRQTGLDLGIFPSSSVI